MRIDFAEVELAGEQKDNGSNRGEVAVATRLAFGCLEQTVDGFITAIAYADVVNSCKNSFTVNEI